MGSVMYSCVTDFFTYETTKSVVVKSWSVGIINRIVQLLIITYFVGWVFIHEKAYQIVDTGIESSVITKVKGFGHHHNRVMDVADYVIPSQGVGVFCILTRVIITENQFQGKCPERGSAHYLTVHTVLVQQPLILHNLSHTPGVITGTCLNSSGQGKGQCEIEGWCPSENDTPMLDVENFTIFIKNSIRFPLFNVTRGNFPSSMTAEEIKTCIYHPERNPFCPIFRVGDVLSFTGQSVENLAQMGAEIGINIQWRCNLDLDIQHCVPKYSFTRLDAPFATNAVSKGYNFRFAKYYKTENGTEFRTLHKAFAIRFDVMVTGHVSCTYLCFVVQVSFISFTIILSFQVSDAQIEACLTQSPGSELSFRAGIKRSYDSGAVSLAASDQRI
uniref:P2X purinoceptor n=1 Tax=Echeneis naucrates TaxID=173247 RepID=A0A665TMT8_ECHNA